MTAEWNKQFWNTLEKHFREITEEVALEKRQDDSYILRCLFTTVKGGTGIALFESRFFQLWDDVLQMEIMVTPQFNIKEEQQRELENIIMNINYYTPVGAFGIHYPTNQLFFRYVVLVDDTDGLEKLTNRIGNIYEMLGKVLGNVYGALERVSKGESTYEQEIWDKCLPRQQ